MEAYLNTLLKQLNFGESEKALVARTSTNHLEVIAIHSDYHWHFSSGTKSIKADCGSQFKVSLRKVQTLAITCRSIEFKCLSPLIDHLQACNHDGTTAYCQNYEI